MLKYVRQLAAESVVYGLSGVVSRLLFVFLVPLYTRVFSPEEYGQMSLVMAAMAAATILVTLALDNSAHRWFWDSEQARDRKKTIASWAWCQVSLALVVAVGVTAVARPLAEILVGRPDAAVYIRIAVWALPLGAWSTVTTNWLRMQRRPWATVAFTLGTTTLNILLTILLVVQLGHGLRGVFEAQVLSMVPAAGISLFVLRDWVHPRYFRGERLREMLRFALPLIPAAVAFWTNSMADRYFVQHYAGTAEVGLYQVGAAVAAVVAMGTTAFQQAWGPFSLSIHQRPDARRFYAAALPLYLWVACAAATAVSILAPEVLRIFTTEPYYESWTVVPYLAFSYVMLGLTYVAAVGPGIAKKTAPLGIGVSIAALMNLLLNFLLTPRWGRDGAALATLVSQAVVPVYVFASARRIYPIPYRFPAAVGIVAFSALLVWLGTVVGAERLWASISLKVALLALFLPLLFALRVVTLGQLTRALRARYRTS